MATRKPVSIDAEQVTALITELQSVNSFEALRQVFVTFLARVGVRMMSYHHLPPLGATDYNPAITVVAHGFPRDWVQRYIDEHLYEIDPIPQHAADAVLPFKWSDARHFDDLSDDNRRYLDMLDEAGLGDGLAIPVFGPHGRNGYSAYGFGKKTLPVGPTEIQLLRWVAQLGHLIYCDLLRARSAEDIHLSKRECEILQWVARGKSNAVIAQILGISPHTVDTHLRRVFVKLSAADRVTAALRGLALGLLG